MTVNAGSAGISIVTASPAVTLTGTSPLMRVVGAPAQAVNLKVVMTLGGAVATATFKASLDGGATYPVTGTTATAGNDVQGVVGLRWAAGTYVLGDAFTWVAPNYLGQTLLSGSGLAFDIATFEVGANTLFSTPAPIYDSDTPSTAIIAGSLISAKTTLAVTIAARANAYAAAIVRASS